MNKIYKVIWSKTTQAWVATSELTRGQGKSSSSNTTNIETLKVVSAVALAGLGVLSVNPAMALGTNAYQCDSVSSTASGAESLACGLNAEASGKGSVALGNEAIATGGSNNTEGNYGASTAVGSGASATEPNATALGANSVSSGNGAVAVGLNSQAVTERTVAVGQGAIAGSATNSTHSATAIGYVAQALGGSSVALGNTAIGRKAIAIGRSAHAYGNNSIALGSGAIAGVTGSSDTIVADLAFGLGAQATGGSSIAQGNGAIASGVNAIAIGNGAQATAENSISIGTGNIVSGEGSGAIGDPNTITGDGSYAYGNDNEITADNAFVVGNNVTNAVEGSVVLGNNSTVAAAVGTASYTINNTTYSFAGTSPVSTVSVGASGSERTITNVAAGRISATSTDAINGSQLYAVTSALNNLTSTITHFYSVNPVNQNTTVGNYDNDGATGGNAMAAGVAATASGDAATAVGVNANASGTASVALGSSANASGKVSTALGQQAQATADAATAVGRQSQATGASSTAVGSGAVASASFATAIGTGANASGAASVASGVQSQASGGQSVAIGRGAVASEDDSVALGAYSTTSAATGTSSAKVNGIEYSGFAGTSPIATVSVGSSGNERTITNVAAGDISPTSTDAINGSQLYATNNVIGEVASSTADILGGNAQVNSDGTISAPTYIVTNGDPSTGNTVAVYTVGDAISNLSTAVQKPLTFETDSGSYAAKLGSTVGVKGDGNNISTSVDSSGNIQVSISDTPTFTSVTTGGTVVNSDGITTNNGNGPSLTTSGIDAAGTKITNVAAGTDDTDAVNVGQLKASTVNINNKINKVDDRASAGVASAMAAAGLPQAYLPGHSMVAVAGGTHRGEHAIALGVSRISDNGKVIVKLTGATNSENDTSASIGVGYQW